MQTEGQPRASLREGQNDSGGGKENDDYTQGQISSIVFGGDSVYCLGYPDGLRLSAIT